MRKMHLNHIFLLKRLSFIMKNITTHILLTSII
ncbi:UNVERIFIED_CONTAM: hypothetical protein GTU68_001252 [Idotea baltica]|nr:hypothetical protein [Idotea baltica]